MRACVRACVCVYACVCVCVRACVCVCVCIVSVVHIQYMYNVKYASCIHFAAAYSADMYNNTCFAHVFRIIVCPCLYIIIVKMGFTII